MSKTPKELSREYYQFVNGFTQSDFEDDKMLGKFYTDIGIAESMIQTICNTYIPYRFNSELRIIDPFCGDGRLVLALLAALSSKQLLHGFKVLVSLWDIDAEAVKVAQDSITEFCQNNDITFDLDAKAADAFVEYQEVCGSYDICVTNPPWSLLKPQKLFSKSNGEESLAGYRNAIEQYDSFMKQEFSVSQPTTKFGKWGTNLARCGTEVALRLIKSDGMCGIVSPSSLLNDQVSSRLRVWIFENFKVLSISYYPAELKLYGSADISSITMVLKGGETDKNINIKIYEDRATFKHKKIEKAVFEYIQRNGYCIPLKTGIEAIPIMMYLEHLPSTMEYCSDRKSVV